MVIYHYGSYKKKEENSWPRICQKFEVYISLEVIHKKTVAQNI